MDILTCDIKQNNQFDSIVTDPPYGFRASARKAIAAKDWYYLYITVNLIFIILKQQMLNY